MIAADLVARGQALAESLMVDTWEAFSPNGFTKNDAGLKTPTWASEGTTVAKAQAGVRQGDVSGERVTVGGTEVLVYRGGLHVPLGAFVDGDGLRLRVGWEFQCTAVGPGTDPAQVGRRLHVYEVPVKAYATARRLDVYTVKSLDLT